MRVGICQFFNPKYLSSFYFIFHSQPGPIPLTIENVLFNALVRVGAVSQDNADNPTKVRMVISKNIHRFCTNLRLAICRLDLLEQLGRTQASTLLETSSLLK